MKLYDKIYLPERQEGARAFRDNQGDVPVAIHGNFIVLTIEELREVFEQGRIVGAYFNIEDNRLNDSKCPPTFNEYLAFKGINTDNNGK